MKQRPGRVLISNLLRRGIVLIVLIVLAAYFSSQTDRFLQTGNLINILQQNAAVIIVAVGMTLTMLVGGIDLSVGSVAALSGAISAGLIVRNGVPFEVAVVITLAMGFFIGLINGSLIVYGKLPPFVATLAMLGIARGLTLLYTDGRPIPNIGDTYAFWGRGQVELPILGAVPAPVIVTLVVVVFFTWLMSQTRFGLYVYAIGGSEETTRLAGVNVNRVKLLTYGLSSTLAALAGMLLTARLFSAQPQLAVGLELDAIAAAVLGGVSLFGGVGNVLGAVSGGLLIGVLTNGMNLLRVPSYQQQMVQGIALVSAVAIDVLSKRLERR
ncbi:MAG: ABC transporter permease [Anaerolineae bacterium]